MRRAMAKAGAHGEREAPTMARLAGERRACARALAGRASGGDGDFDALGV